MTRNQLPEGVGKKIVEALKRQSEIEITPIAEEEEFQPVEEVTPAPVKNLEYFENVISEEVNENIQTSEMEAQDNFIIEEPLEEPEVPQFNFNYENAAPISNETMTLDTRVEYKLPEEDMMQNNVEKSKSFDIPANVAVLKRLISQLPAGVTKQTGAQIIRQTIEALGISMNSVLQEAQQVQDSLNTSIKDCMGKVQEYKTNIMHLERHAQDYQRQVSQLNDLISLFILTDKNLK